jgi:hypothetical protein
MYPDFLASPELALECLRRENHVARRQSERYRLAQLAAAPPSHFLARFGAAIARRFRSAPRLNRKPELASMPASSR